MSLYVHPVLRNKSPKQLRVTMLLRKEVYNRTNNRLDMEEVGRVIMGITIREITKLISKTKTKVKSSKVKSAKVKCNQLNSMTSYKFRQVPELSTPQLQVRFSQQGQPRSESSRKTDLITITTTNLTSNMKCKEEGIQTERVETRGKTQEMVVEETVRWC